MLKAGFSRIAMTPPLGTPLAGYFEMRYADGILDPLYINARALNDGEETIIIITADTLIIRAEVCDLLRGMISERTGVPADHVLVVSDDTTLAVGRLRIRKGGSAGGHNGLKNIIQHLGTDQFPRLRLGVGEKPHPDYDLADWVLGKFQGEDKKAMDAAVKKAADAVECILSQGLDKGMNKFNG